MDFTSDKNVYDKGGEYMFGKSLLVSPVTEPGVSQWEVYLPEGSVWWDFWTNDKFAGGATVAKDVPLDIIPLYVRAGSIIPFGPAMQYSSEKPWDDIEIHIYPGADGSFTLYEDENDNYNYENGDFSIIRFHWDDASNTLTIADREGSFPGMLKKRKFRLTLASGNLSAGDKDSTTAKNVNYNGKRISVKL